MYKCDHCNGTGFVSIDKCSIHFCKKCKGYRELNWIEMIFGKMITEKEDILKFRSVVKKIYQDIGSGKIKVDEELKQIWGVVDK
jgi:DnaJ-class molecular chaperone